MISYGKKNILGILVDAVDYEATVEQIIQAAKGRRGFAVSAAAVHTVMEGVLDKEHRYRLNQFAMIVPDGQPVRWALNLLHGLHLKNRVYGPTLTVRALEAAERAGIPVFFYGGSDELLQAVRRNLSRSYPKLAIAGTEASKFRRLFPGEKQEIAGRIRSSGAGILFVGLGCPRQDVWAYEFRECVPMPMLCVGGAFGILAGKSTEAPSWMQDRGLEWVYRLSREPRRLWRRYLLLNPLYTVLVAGQALGLKWRDSGRPPETELLYG